MALEGIDMLTAFYEIIDTAYIIAGILMNYLERLIDVLSYDICRLSIIIVMAFLPFLLASLLMSAYISDRNI